MTIYGILEDYSSCECSYEGYLDEFFTNKENAKKYLTEKYLDKEDLKNYEWENDELINQKKNESEYDWESFKIQAISIDKGLISG